MSDNGKNGVTVGFREIYDQMLGVSRSLERLDYRMKNIEDKFETVNRVDERSRDALMIAKESKKMSVNNIDDIDNLKKDLEKKDRDRKNDIRWFIGTAIAFIGLLVPIFIKLFL